MLLIKQAEKEQIKNRISKVPTIFKSTLFSLAFFEALGTLILTFGICVSMFQHPIVYRVPNQFATFIISAFLYFGLSISGPFSGGHLNPSVTASLVSSNLCAPNRIGYYMVSQLVGALLGGLLSFLFFNEFPTPYPETAQFSSIILDGVGQIIGTFIFTFGIIYTTKQNYMKGEYFTYFFIALMLLIGRTFTFRKQCINPAVGIAIQLFGSIKGTDDDKGGDPLAFFGIFGIVIGSLIGGILAGLFYDKFYEPLLNEIEEK